MPNEKFLESVYIYRITILSDLPDRFFWYTVFIIECHGINLDLSNDDKFEIKHYIYITCLFDSLQVVNINLNLFW